MQLRFWKRGSYPEASSDVISDNPSSSPVNQSGGTFLQGGYIIEYPDPDFETRFEPYETIGRIFSAVESVVKAVNKRDYYFANVDEDNKSDTKIKLMEQWEEEFNGSKFIEDLVRIWLKGGTAVIGPDWQFVPPTSIKYMKRDLYGNVKGIILDVNGKEWPLGAVEERGTLVQKMPIEQYIISHYIHNPRDAWGKGLYHSITTTFTDVDGHESTPLYEGFRQMEQDGIRMHHKLAAQKSIWIFPKLRNKEDLNVQNPKSLAYRISKMRQGDSLVGGAEFEGASKLTDQLDGKTRFPEVTDLIKGEVEVSAQSSAARLIEDPSAMADAREANTKDDDTVLYVCELIRRLFDYVIIPRVVGDKSVEFRWGSSDDFEFDFEQSLAALREGAISVEEFREQWKGSGAKLDDALFQKMQDDKAAKAQQIMGNQKPPEEPEDGDEEIDELRKKAYRKIAEMA